MTLFNLLAQVGPDHVAAICLAEAFLIVSLLIAYIAREQYIKSLHKSQTQFVVDVMETLQDVTQAMTSVTKSIETSTSASQMFKLEMLTSMNAVESRLTTSIDRISRAVNINNIPVGNVSGPGIKIGDNRDA